MKIRALKVSAFCGLRELEVKIPPRGAIFQGGNAKGKTTAIKAVATALNLLDLKEDAIRKGHDATEIFVDADVVQIARSLKRGGKATLKVEKDGLRPSKPATYLKELLGASSLDPLDLFLAEPKERKAKILAALPVTVTREQLAKYTTHDLPLDLSLEGHGLEVVQRAHDFFYAERTQANRDVKEAEQRAKLRAEEAQRAAAAVTPGPLVPAADARAALSQAERALLTLETKAREADEFVTRTSESREKIARLRAEADAIVVPTAFDTAPLAADVRKLENEIAELEGQLEAARRQLTEAKWKLEDARSTNGRIESDANRVTVLRSQADALEAALGAATVEAPPPAELEAARKAVSDATATLERAHLQDLAVKAIAVAEEAKKTAASLKDEAAELDTTVRRLANEAPNDLLTSSGGISGLSLDGDEVLLDGVRLTSLSGAEQLKFAVEIARRANEKSRLLIVDGLERLDEEQLKVFIEQATRDDWQLLGSLVTGGDLLVFPLEDTAPEEAAAE